MAAGHEVVVLDSLIAQVHGPNPVWPEAVSGAKCIVGDVRKTDELTELLVRERPQAIVHLAARVGVGQAEYEFDEYTSVNVMGTLSLLRAILRANDSLSSEQHIDGVRRLVVTGSMSAYGEGYWMCPKHAATRPIIRDPADLRSGRWAHRCPYPNCPHDALDTCLPLEEFAYQNVRGVYALTKREQEWYAHLFGDSHGLSVAVARLFNVYGPGQALSNPYTGVAAIFAAKCLKGERPIVFEDGQQLRDLVHVSDVAAALLGLVGDPVVKLALRAWSSGRLNGPFNVATGSATTVYAVAELAADILAPGLTPEVTGRFRVGDIRGCLGNWSRLQEAIGWAPRVLPEDGLPQLFRSFGDQHRAMLADVDLSVAQRELEARRLLTDAPAPDGEPDTDTGTGFQRDPTVWSKQ